MFAQNGYILIDCSGILGINMGNKMGINMGNNLLGINMGNIFWGFIWQTFVGKNNMGRNFQVCLLVCGGLRRKILVENDLLKF